MSGWYGDEYRSGIGEESALAEALELLEYALHLRRHGERAPGGSETWREFEQRCETFLRENDGLL